MYRIASVLLISCLIAAGQIAGKGGKATGSEAHANVQSQPTNQAPIIQTRPDSEPSRERTEQAGRSNGPHDWVDKVNALSTLVIAAFTAAMFFMVRAQVREYRTRERAWMVFSIEQPPTQVSQGGQPTGFSIVGFLRNVGSTPATIVKQSHFGNIGNRGDFTAVPPYMSDKPLDSAYSFVPNDVRPALFHVDDSQMRAAFAGRVHIYVFGQIVYRDVFGKGHETRYCFRYYPTATADHQTGFYPEGPAEYLKVT
ncbi:MAG TPA: hypothetical protein VGS78_05405 [Candidatus Sulfotelmatobacter sp.]|nr:hypothetical protein [Candidatus Sulfotelmatobacter sp.]